MLPSIIRYSALTHGTAPTIEKPTGGDLGLLNYDEEYEEKTTLENNTPPLLVQTVLYTVNRQRMQSK